MTVLLDTDHASMLQIDEEPATTNLRARLAKLPPSDVKLTIVSFQEQVEGWLNYIRRARKNRDVINGFRFLRGLLRIYEFDRVMPYDEVAWHEFLNLQKLRIRIGTNDLRIAAIAKANHAKLLSRNLRDFRRVPGLDVEDWTTA